MNTAKMGIMAGVLVLGSIGIASAQGWFGCCGAQPIDQANGSQTPAATANAAWVCPYHGTNCMHHSDYAPAPSAGDQGAARADTGNQTAYYGGCHHWYRWFVPGHRARCGWSGDWNHGRCW